MYDVIIVGAGPAGSTAARECAHRGLKTLLVDREHFPRSKPCGGAVSEHALSYLGFSLPHDIIEQECYGADISYKQYSVAIRKPYRIAVLVSRERFDAFLVEQAQAAGAEFVSGQCVTSVVTTRGAVEVRTETSPYTARYCIGADGVHSHVARSLRPPLAQREMALAVVSSVAVDSTSGSGQCDGTIQMYFSAAPWGYAWIFPHGRYCSVGVLGLASEFGNPVNTLQEFSRSRGISLGTVRGHFIPLGGIKRKVVSDRILLTGDAAGFTDPFHGEGIAYAILSGKLAARAVADAVRSEQPATAFSAYAQRCERLIERDLRVALGMARLRERFPTLFRRIFFDNPNALEKYLDIPAARCDYRRFGRWLIASAPFSLLAGPVRNILKHC